MTEKVRANNEKSACPMPVKAVYLPMPAPQVYMRLDQKISDLLQSTPVIPELTGVF